MTTRYRVEYALTSHRRDQFIEWIKGLLAVPFVLNSQPTAAYNELSSNLARMAKSANERYAEIMRDVEELVKDQIAHQSLEHPTRSKLKMLVPTIGTFFTPLALETAFQYQDSLRAISSRRFVPPSFNDIRLILNTAQVLSLVQASKQSSVVSRKLELVTFDGDVTLYDDGGSLDYASPVIPYLLHLLSLDTKIGIVTAAGYTEPGKYHDRLYGLLEAVANSTSLTGSQKSNLFIMGGESNFLFVNDVRSPHRLRYIKRREWILPSMRDWSDAAIQSLLDIAEKGFEHCIETLRLPAQILRKERAVGIFPQPGKKLTREQLEETVLVVQQIVETDEAAHGRQRLGGSVIEDGGSHANSKIKSPLPFCAFNGGNDCFVDVGDKSLGVQSLQQWVGGTDGSRTLHVGDQFLSGGGNDFKARQACTTAWIASPKETVDLLEEIIAFMELSFDTIPPASAIDSCQTIQRLRQECRLAAAEHEEIPTGSSKGTKDTNEPSF